jgi:exonuclease SbcC
MSRTDQLFNPLRLAIESLWTEDEMAQVAIRAIPHVLLLTSPSDVAAFSVFNAHPSREYDEAYTTFKRLYSENNLEWDKKTLSFVVCRTSERTEDDRFYASLENDPLFCRKYIIRAHDDLQAQREELLRLPFLPLRGRGADGMQRPQSAQDFLQSAGVSAELSRNLIEVGHRSAERIAADIRDKRETLPQEISQPRQGPISLTRPRALTRLLSLSVEGFRVYRELQTFDLDASVVVLYGPNGLGKTSLFDAIDYACTGRIGRLCNRQLRNQTEFSRIATHLDKTSGSGSVVLMGRSTAPDEKSAEWRLQRSTGNWTTAWLDGERVDRKAVINRLTHANWGDTIPRQQTLERLFRAIHLFGQDEQELLSEFKNGSVIPEAFISEMLALQDYSQGLVKVADVLAQLSGQRQMTDGEVSELRAQIASVRASLPQMPAAEDLEPTAIESILADLRREVGSIGVPQIPTDAQNLVSFSEWQDVVAARIVESNDRIRIAHETRNELPEYERQLGELAVEQGQLERLDKEIEQIRAEEREIRNRIDAISKALSDVEANRRLKEQRRQSIRVFQEVRAELRDLSKQIDTLQAERDRQELERSEIDSRLIAAESALSAGVAGHADADRQLAACRSRLAAVSVLLEELPQFAGDDSLAADLRERLLKTRQGLQAAQQREAQAAANLQEIKGTRETLRPEYERALADQAELERLLDSIQMHMHDKSCPLCGSEFESLEALRARIRLRRSSVSQDMEFTLRYKTILANEAQAEDSLRVAVADVVAAKETIDELSDVLAKTERRLTGFRTRLAAAFIEPANAETLARTLASRRNESQHDCESLGEKTEVARRDLAAIQSSHDQETTKRQAIYLRIVDLERTIRQISDQMDQLAARSSQILPADLSAESDLEAEVARIDQAVSETAASIEQLGVSGNRERESASNVSAQRANLFKQREQIASSLTALNHSISSFRQKLVRFGLTDDAAPATLDKAIQQQERRRDAMHGVIEKGSLVLAALGAREARLQIIQKQAQIDELSKHISALEERRRHLDHSVSLFSSIERLLTREHRNSIERHIAAYGPMITMIQQRLRSVYGFGGVHLESQSGQTTVHVEWRNKGVQLTPTDFFSDSQRQILMLSIFLAGGLRQNWSGFAPMLLDDPVTHFDDLNAYAFVELLRGIISTSPNERQFIISTCEERLFELIRRKLSRLPSGATFYEFLGMTEKGPIVQRR